MYTKNLTAHRGTDNQILIEFVNQDQKRVDLTKTVAIGDPVPANLLVPGQLYCITTVGDTAWATTGAVNCSREGTKFTATATAANTANVGYATPIEAADLSFTLRLISHDGTTLLLEKPLNIVNRTAGQTKIVLTEEELDLIAPGRVGFSIEQTADGSLYEPVYVDDNAGARGYIDIVDSIMPSFIESELLTIPTPTTPSYVSSTLNTDATDLHTFQITMDNFTGTIETRGAADTDNNWYSINSDEVAESNMYVYTVEGYHPYIQFTFTEADSIAAGLFTVGNEYTIKTTGDTDFTLIGAADSNPGTIFIATGVGTGTGTAVLDSPGTITEIRHR